MVVEKGGASENQNVMMILGQQVLHPADAVEPYQFHGAGAVGELRGNAFRAAGTQHLVAGDVAAELHVVAFLLYVADFVNGGFIYMAERKVVEQVAEGEDVELTLEHIGTLRTDALEKFDRSL